MVTITDEHQHYKIDFNGLRDVLDRLGLSPTRSSTSYGPVWTYHCQCGMHEHGDRKRSGMAWIDRKGQLAVKCWIGYSRQARRNLLTMMGASQRDWSGPHFKAGPKRDDKKDGKTRTEKAQKVFDLAFTIRDEGDSPPRTWLGEKCGFKGRVPPAIRWKPDISEDSMVGSIIAMMAPLQAWTDAAPDVPDLTAIQKVGIKADGKKAFGFNLEGQWHDKLTYGPMGKSVVLFGDATGRSTVRVAEGIADALAVHGRFQQTTVALCGAGRFHNADIAKDLATFDEVIIHADAGGPGTTAALALRDAIREDGGTAYAFAPGRGNDPADAFGDIGEPLTGDDPDDAFWKFSEASHDGAVGGAAAAGADHAGKEGLVIEWDRLEREYAFDTLRIPGRNSESYTSGVHEQTCNFQNAYFEPPIRPDEMRCTEQYGTRSNLPKGEAHWDPRDCGKCPSCRQWWQVLQAARFSGVGEGKAILTVECPNLVSAAAWRKAQADRLNVKCVQVIEPTENSSRVISIYFGDVTEKDIGKTLTNMKKRGQKGKFVSRAVNTEDFKALLPLEKRVESEPGTKIDTISWSHGIPQVKRPPKPRTYLKGDPVLVNEYLPPERIKPMPEKYVR